MSFVVFTIYIAGYYLIRLDCFARKSSAPSPWEVHFITKHLSVTTRHIQTPLNVNSIQQCTSSLKSLNSFTVSVWLIRISVQKVLILTKSPQTTGRILQLSDGEVRVYAVSDKRIHYVPWERQKSMKPCRTPNLP